MRGGGEHAADGCGAQVGVSAAQLQELPTLPYADAVAAARILKIDSQCTVCQERFESVDAVTLLPCHHVYHAPCIATWLACSRACPVCNADVGAGGENAERGRTAVAAAPATPEAPKGGA